ncbi:MAG: hypothetical protein MK098_11080 [Marinovum sp.]|nr:hypothetical protein [Marinovum sp.]
MSLAALRTVLGIASALLLGALFWLSERSLTPAGFDTFDGSPLGYDKAYAIAYLSALNDEARAIYTGPVRILDSLFPPVFTGFLVLMLLRSIETWPRPLRVPAMLFPVAYLVFDLLENRAVAHMLSLPIKDLGEDLVARASLFTQAKYLSFMISGLAILLFGILFRRGKGAV